METPDTIAAIATPFGTAGLGIIRVSGPMASELGRLLFRPAHQTCNWQSHHSYYGDIVSACGTTILDEVLVTLMCSPHSFTGEDVLEISCHGNPLILQTILEQLMTLGCRPARPGEFTERAYLNGRMDLSQAEALAAVISAQSEKARQIGLAQLKGSLGRKIGDLRTLLIDALAGLEAAIDFTDDVHEDETPSLPPQIHEAIAGIELLLSTYRQARLFTCGINVIITGKPNVGKSSLLNSLAGRKKAIVTDIPGTTRDLIHQTITLNGLAVHLTDTAGIRKPQDAIEKEGIDLVWEHLEQADIIIILLDGSKPLTPEDRHVLEQNKNRDCKIITAINKSDLPAAWNPDLLLDYPLQGLNILKISAKFGDGLDALKKAVTDLTGSNNFTSDGGMITQLRHKLALEKALASLAAAHEAVTSGRSPEFGAFELRCALDALDEITGKKIHDDILHKIFSSFCIGK
ncbi:MAG: tRNA uridine-5-carboxymethylaminomethyl(34) synthesis GTPase MnmE [Deltaproteobacteria bacterium HGW-Deltaproteobacteria-6]|nr:MAG: tRNA uridine-5-carboxymethylaminomethyl(34) synthesis GTPase MnmE [Deltaproteobacteria bacterium HGW-Deltaproteobacteria-6]